MSSESFQFLVAIEMVSSGHSSLLFASPSKLGPYNAYAAFLPTENRFKWHQYDQTLSDTMGCEATNGNTSRGKSFGTSTRENWDVTKAGRKQSPGPNAYNLRDSFGTQPLSEHKTAVGAKFDKAPRVSLHDHSSPSPGPIYDIFSSSGHRTTSNGTKFGSAERQPLHGNFEKEGMQSGSNALGADTKSSFSYKKSWGRGSGTTFGCEKRLQGDRSTKSVPGPIYDLDPTGYKTGGVLSFTKEKRFR
ncbi:hypothetical protein ABG067_006277 [Albugo candida]|uniref:Uncharacterized protein n=1 Tax=Albugo candida TaxID=65357 RepID=A0A024GD42_9STRA|nr:unnamed protein product [Albugo candida]|eukprot:CCI44692.1 unnamed protein product [Albugo candida]